MCSEDIPMRTEEIEIGFEYEDVEVNEVLIPVKLFGEIVSHVLAFYYKTKLEHAGILTGIRLGEVIVVTGAYPAKRIRTSSTGFTIPEEELRRIDEERKNDSQPGFVGLYHLHLGFGVFLSSRDIKATERFCKFYGTSINLVISVSRGKIEYGFFTVDEDGKARELAYRFLVGRYHV